MPGAGFMNEAKIKAQLSKGIIDLPVVDASVMRILTTMFKFGVMVYSISHHFYSISLYFTPRHSQFCSISPSIFR